MSTEELKHLEFIQNVITRMNTNSFQIKGWMIAIASAVLAICASTKNNYFIIAGIFPTLMFWLLDAYYLMQERKFQGLYNDVAGVSKNPKNIKLFEMRPDLYTGGKYSYWNVLWSESIWTLYLTVVAALIILFIFLGCSFKGG